MSEVPQIHKAVEVFREQSDGQVVLVLQVMSQVMV